METIEKSIKSKMLGDDAGNSLLIVRNKNLISLYLRLKAERHKRKLGIVNMKTRTFYVTRKKDIHLFRKLNAYGFCYYVIANAKMFDNIRLKDETGEWLIPVSFLINRENQTKYLHFKGIGFELQIFAPLEAIQQFKRPDRF